MENKILYLSLLAVLPFAFPAKSSAQCHIKDVIMGTVPEDTNPDDERYFWTKTPDSSQANVVKKDVVEYAPHTLILLYGNPKDKKNILKAVKRKKCSVLYDYKIISGVAIKTPEAWKIDDAIRYFQTIKGVKSVEKDRVMHTNQAY